MSNVIDAKNRFSAGNPTMTQQCWERFRGAGSGENISFTAVPTLGWIKKTKDMDSGQDAPIVHISSEAMGLLNAVHHEDGHTDSYIAFLLSLFAGFNFGYMDADQQIENVVMGRMVVGMYPADLCDDQLTTEKLCCLTTWPRQEDSTVILIHTYREKEKVFKEYFDPLLSKMDTLVEEIKKDSDEMS